MHNFRTKKELRTPTKKKDGGREGVGVSGVDVNGMGVGEGREAKFPFKDLSQSASSKI